MTRIGSRSELQQAVAAWQASRESGKAVWRFTTATDRIKLRRL